MLPLMSEAEMVLFSGFLAVADRYVEFGAGGTTCLAAAAVKGSVVSVDSSRHWLAKVGARCAQHPEWTAPELIFADIGPIGDYGVPVDPASRPLWPAYHSTIWNEPARAQADLFMVDGRFRVACVMQILLRCRPDAFIVVHDYNNRPDYQVIGEVARIVALVETMAVFQRRLAQDDRRIRELLNRHEFQAR